METKRKAKDPSEGKQSRRLAYTKRQRASKKENLLAFLNSNTLAYVILVVMLIVTIQLVDDRFDTFKKIEDLKQSQAYLIMDEMQEQIDQLVYERNKMRITVRELWFQGMDSETAIMIMNGGEHDCDLKQSTMRVTNDYFNLVEYRPGGYLLYEFENAVTLFDRNGDQTCFDDTKKRISCDELCSEVYNEKTKL